MAIGKALGWTEFTIAKFGKPFTANIQVGLLQNKVTNSLVCHSHGAIRIRRGRNTTNLLALRSTIVRCGTVQVHLDSSQGDLGYSVLALTWTNARTHVVSSKGSGVRASLSSFATTAASSFLKTTGNSMGHNVDLSIRSGLKATELIGISRCRLCRVVDVIVLAGSNSVITVIVAGQGLASNVEVRFIPGNTLAGFVGYSGSTGLGIISEFHGTNMSSLGGVALGGPGVDLILVSSRRQRPDSPSPPVNIVFAEAVALRG